jgi:hypothetical protein
MTPEQQRIAIAEACGWSLVEDHLDYEPFWEDPKGNMIAVGSATHRLPDYLSDLNAMHEAEKMLNSKMLWETYKAHLLNWMTEPICATSRQRAEAFLRTVGRWEE